MLTFLILEAQNVAMALDTVAMDEGDDTGHHALVDEALHAIREATQARWGEAAGVHASAMEIHFSHRLHGLSPDITAFDGPRPQRKILDLR
jgi:hypothetical protein